MRRKTIKQLPLNNPAVDHPFARELKMMDSILEENKIVYDLAHADLIRNTKSNAGANGMSAEQVVKIAILKQMTGLSYKKLAFHLIDSTSYRRFCHIGIGDKTFKKSALCKNVKRLSPETWEEIHRIIIGYAQGSAIEKGREVRIDCTVVSSNIHAPTDSSLLYDSVKVLARLLKKSKEDFGETNSDFANHTKRAKRRALAVLNAKNKNDRKKYYIDLIKVTRQTIGYSEAMVLALSSNPSTFASLMADEIKSYIALALEIIDQTERRVNNNEKVPSSEKVTSIFEPHTDIIRKDRRDTFFGHKICLTGGSSNLILDCKILDGNPADVTLVDDMLDRQNDIYNRYPLKVAFDGGFTSKSNLDKALDKGIKDVCFSKRRNLETEDMCRSEWVYKRLRKFRAGIEAGISRLKRCFGLSTCTWKSLRSFKSYVWASIVSANLQMLARHKLSSM